jgi:ferredoxin
MQPLSLLKDLIIDSSQEIDFIESRCLRKRLNKCNCSCCISSCPAGALSLREHQVVFDKDICSSCMRCVAVCPNEAFLSPGNDLHSLAKSLSNQEHVVFTCPQQNLIHPDDHVIPCMGLFSIELLFILGMTGPPTITFNVAGCSGCRNKASSDAFLTSLKQIEQHASALLSAKFVVTEEHDLENRDNNDNRRYFISTLANNLASVTRSQITNKSDKSCKTQSTTRRVPQKVESIKLLIEFDKNNTNVLLLPLCTHQIDVSSKCTLCPLCAGICPTGALKIKRINEEKKLMFNSIRCSGCGLCVSFCKHNAISLTYPLISETIHNRIDLRERDSVKVLKK